MIQKTLYKKEATPKYQGHISCPIVLKNNTYFIDNGDLYEIITGSQYSSKILEGPINQLNISEDYMHLSFCMYGDIYLFNTQTKTLERLTYFENNSIINCGWYDNNHLLVTTSICSKRYVTYKINIQTLSSEKCYGNSCMGFAISRNGDEVIQIHGFGYENWRKYQGGTVASLWLKRTKDKEYKKLLMDDKYAQYNCYSPVFVDERLFFLVCDDTGAANIHEYIFDHKNPEKSKVIQKTFHSDFCVLRGFFGIYGRISYTCGGKPYLLAIDTNKIEKLDISHKPVIEKEDMQKTLLDSHEYITSISVNKKFVSLATRGKIFTSELWSDVFKKQTDELRYKHAIFIDDHSLLCIKNSFDSNKKIMSSTFEIHDLKDQKIKQIVSHDGIVECTSLVHQNRILFSNHMKSLHCLDIDNKTISKICSAPDQDLGGFALSPDGKWATYSIITPAITCVQLQYKSIYIQNIDSNKEYKLTNNYLNNEIPTFSANGEYIWYTSNVIFKPEYDEEIFNLYYRNTAQICVIPLNKDAKNPLDVWHTIENKVKDEADEAPKTKKKSSKKQDCKITPKDFDNIQVFHLKDIDIPNSRISYVRELGKNILLIGSRPYSNKRQLVLHTFNLETSILTNIAEDVLDFNLSNDLSELIVITQDEIKIGKPTEAFSSSDKSFKKGGVLSLPVFSIDIASEYQNIFDESWWYVIQRFWDPKILDNLKWNDIYDKYNTRVQEIRSKHELNKLLCELYGELQASHAFLINQGDVFYRRSNIGYLGISCVLTDKGYMADEVLKVDEESLYPEASIHLQKKDIIKSINGQECTTNKMLEHYLMYKANKRVHIEFIRNDKIHDCYVKLLDRSSMRSLVEKYFAESNRKYVYQKTGNNIGYIYIPDMQVFGFTFFTKHFREAISKDVIIVDLRYNSGGHTSSMIFKLLSNIQVAYGKSPDNDYYRFPCDSHTGKLVFICNQMTASDGEIAAQHAKHLGYKLIGVRTWGGVIGIHVRDVLVDNTILSCPEHATIYPKLKKQVENYGVEPTCIVEQNINDMLRNLDPQLDAAIECAKKLYDELEDWQKHS